MSNYMYLFSCKTQNEEIPFLQMSFPTVIHVITIRKAPGVKHKNLHRQSSTSKAGVEAQSSAIKPVVHFLIYHSQPPAPELISTPNSSSSTMTTSPSQRRIGHETTARARASPYLGAGQEEECARQREMNQGTGGGGGETRGRPPIAV